MGERDAAATPDWLVPLAAKSGPALASGLGGFYFSYPRFSVAFTMGSTDRLVVSFDNLSVVKDRSPARDAWGGRFFREMGWSVLGILPYEANWYRDPQLFACLEGLRDQGFFGEFARVSFTGTSMGGYAACAFAGLAPGATVVAFSPQSTLRKALVPWEKRFNRGRRADWSGPYADAAAEIRGADRVYLVYDPYEPGDRRHVSRFPKANVTRLRAFLSGHRTVVFLRKAEILKQVMTAAVRGELEPAEFYRLYRARRALPWHSFALMERALARPTDRLADRLIAYHARAGRQRLAEQLARKKLGLADAEDPGPEADG
jgi:hypothetical protein